MKRLLIAALAVMLPLTVLAQQIPSLELSDAKGKAVTTASLVDGKTPFAVTFWASWCRPCRQLIPVLKEIYAGQPEGRLQIFSCSVDQDAMAWRVALQEEKMPWPQAREDADHKGSDKYGVQYIPYTILIDREGHIVGVNLEEPELEAILLGE